MARTKLSLMPVRCPEDPNINMTKDGNFTAYWSDNGNKVQFYTKKKGQFVKVGPPVPWPIYTQLGAICSTWKERAKMVMTMKDAGDIKLAEIMIKTNKVGEAK